MNKRTERVLLVVVAAILVLYGIYQVTYGTNESSYRFGYGYGKDEFSSCTYPADPSNGEIADCFGVYNSYSFCMP